MFWIRGGDDSVQELQVNDLAIREALCDLGVAVHRVGDAYDLDEDGVPFSTEVRQKWFVAVVSGSSLDGLVDIKAIPLSGSEGEAWDLAWKVFGPHIEGRDDH